MFGLPHAGAPVRIMTFATELHPIHPTQEVLGSASEAGGEKSAKSIRRRSNLAVHSSTP
jgi:hypothetical protein